MTVPRNLPADEQADLTVAYKPPDELGISGRIEKVFPGSSPNKLLLMAKEATLDLSPNWIFLELSISTAHTQSSQERVSVRPAFILPGDLEPEWIRMAQDRTFVILVRKADQMLMLAEVDMDDSADYKKAIGRNNGKYQ